MIRRILPLIAVLVLPGGFAAAQEKLPDGAKLAKLEARPAAVKLTGPFTYAQILVTGRTRPFGENETSTLTISSFAMRVTSTVSPVSSEAVTRIWA